MKQVLNILLVAMLLLACNTGTEKEKTVSSEPATESHAEHAEKAAGLTLNNGAKWKADSITIANVDLLRNTITDAKKVSLGDYSQTAASLQDGLDKMVRECKMQGADHEALHHWLEPLMEKTRELKNAGNLETAKASLDEIEKQINLFPQYFE